MPMQPTSPSSSPQASASSAEDIDARRDRIRSLYHAQESVVLDALIAEAEIDADARAQMTCDAVGLIESLRRGGGHGLMEVFLEEYGLSTDEGVALMCLAEALLRVPDADTIDELIEDKIAPSSWSEHLGQSSSPLVNASTWALMLTGKVLNDERGRGVVRTLNGALRRLGEPVIRTAVKQAMKELGSQFVLGQSIGAAMKRAQKQESKGYTYSYDMLGEAALTQHDADIYFERYRDAIKAISMNCAGDDPRRNPGISIKLSALHPRYEFSQRERVMRELVPRVQELALLAREAQMGMSIDAEEADRLELSLDVIEASLSDPRLAGWDGFGVVVQAYGRRVGPVVDFLYTLAVQHDRRLMIRLVKGAYWDTEIKHAQAEGLQDFPVFTTKPATDVAYICCAAKLLAMSDRLYSQFATHNAHTMAAVLNLAKDPEAFEFQRLHGMGSALHDLVLRQHKSACRIYAPVGEHRDLLAYLVRRLLENGANSSFVNQVVNEDIPPALIASDPFEKLIHGASAKNRAVVQPAELYAPQRVNSQGWNLLDGVDLARLDRARAAYFDCTWSAAAASASGAALTPVVAVSNPARPSDRVGEVAYASTEQLELALSTAREWSEFSARERGEYLRRAADLYEDNTGELVAVLAREAGKSLPDTISELREAVDFLRYYAAESEKLQQPPLGVMTCISPWNFPLAIFTGQVAAALAAGNGVLAKPAETTSLCAAIATRLLHEAGVPNEVLQLLPGTGAEVGGALTSDPRVAGVCFTGSTATAMRINRTMAECLDPRAPLIAETGGINAMIVDSTALPEQAVRDIIASAFQSAGQRCSALRVLYVQEDIAPSLISMIKGAMNSLQVGDPWESATDIGPVIDEQARGRIREHIARARAEGRLIHELEAEGEGFFVGPALLRVGGIGDLEEEVFGPVLHVATFKTSELNDVVDAINRSGYGLTFGLHTRIDDRVEALTARLRVGNIYVNRNQIGAIVGSQPFGGEGLSGTGPKAGGPHYLKRFTRYAGQGIPQESEDETLVLAELEQALQRASSKRESGELPKSLSSQELPGPTGESNRLSVYGRGVVLCLGQSESLRREQAAIALAAGCSVFDAEHDVTDCDLDLVVFDGSLPARSALRRALASLDGPLIPLTDSSSLADYCLRERHVCIDTTAAGGNASLLAASSVGAE